MNKDYLKTKKRVITKNTVFWVFLILILSSIPLTHGYDEQSEKQIILNYYFKYPTIKTINIFEDKYDRISLEDCVTAGNSGEPNIPSKGAYILLPPNSLRCATLPKLRPPDMAPTSFRDSRFR